MRNRHVLLRIAIFALPTLIVLLTVGVVTSIAVSVQERSIRSSTEERVQEVAVTLSAHPQVREVLAQLAPDQSAPAGTDALPVAEATQLLQPLASVIELTAGVDFVVITDTNGVRLTHPTPELRGQTVSTDLQGVLDGDEFLGTEVGTLGPTLRAKVPVHDGEQLLGALSVGVRESSISTDHSEALEQLLPWAVGALLFGTVTSSLVSAAFERHLRRQEDTLREFAALRRTTTALHEQAHEFHTQLHVVHGLVSQGHGADALDYIDTLAPVQRGSDESGVPDQALLRATLDAVRSELLGLGAHLETDIAVTRDVDPKVLFVLTNLCRNAGEAGATVVRCTLTEGAEGFQGMVEDNGPGIDPRLTERVFLRGFTSKPGAHSIGRGIGLDMVRRTVAERGGAIEHTTSPLGGARFSFEMSTEHGA